MGGTGDLFAGHQLGQGRYIIQAKIAQGGMGAIYKAKDNRLSDQGIVIKEMNEAIIDLQERAAFRQEAEILARLNHPNLVKVFDFFEENKRQYMIMEFIPGRTLLEILEERPGGISEDQVLIWAEQLCEVLGYLHGQQPKIIYRDLKPVNIMEVQGTTLVKVIDFGIARFHKPGRRKDTITFGTPGYSPPEQYGKGQTDERSDIYALGATLHHLLTGSDPSSGKPFFFLPVRSLNNRVSQRVSDAIAKAVSTKIDERFASMVDMQSALLGGDVGSSRSPPSGSRSKSQSNSKPVPQPVSHQFSLSQTHIDFGNVHKGQNLPLQRKISGAGPGLTVLADQSWLEARSIPVGKNITEITVVLRPESMTFGRKQWPVKPRGNELPDRVMETIQRIVMFHAGFIVPVSRTYQGKVSLSDQNGHQEEVAVTATLTPESWHTILGWGGVAGAILVEVLAVLLVFSALIQSCT